MSRARYRLGFDIGGTFTDYVLLDARTGAVHIHKSLTDAVDPAHGAAEGLRALLAREGLTGADIDIAIHATTLITNAMIERKGRVTGLITTEGFRDIIEMGTEVRYDLYDLRAPAPVPLVPRSRRYELRERLDRDGNTVIALNPDDVAALAARLRADEVEAVAVVLLHSYRNADHELRVAEILRAALPDLCISLSSTVSPEVREYERCSTTIANAYTQPITRDYLGRLARLLAEIGCNRPLHMMVSSGGIAAAAAVADMPIRLLESGPAAGVLAAVHDSRRLGIADLITFDMGGTTAKIALIKGHEPAKATNFEVGRTARFKRGSGLPIRLPVIELIEIGAGGGSIAKIDQLGLIGVGPESAGSLPGPACYGRGGTRPTVTDANLVLGYLDPNFFLGGAMPLDAAAAHDALARSFAPLGLNARDAARGVFEIVNQSMLAAARIHVAERCEDPRKFHLYAFGGAGPAHAYELARALGMKGVIVPAGAGTGSAMGLVASPAAFEFARSYPAPLSEAAWPKILDVFRAMESDAGAILAQAGYTAESAVIGVSRALDLRHAGQGHEMTLRLPDGPPEALTPAGVAAAFYAAHRAQFGHAHPHLPIELVTCRLAMTGPAPLAADGLAATPSHAGGLARKGMRSVYFPELQGWRETPVFDRHRLRPGDSFAGPTIIEETECTIVAGPSALIRVDATGAIFLDLANAAAADAADAAAELTPAA